MPVCSVGALILTPMGQSPLTGPEHASAKAGGNALALLLSPDGMAKKGGVFSGIHHLVRRQKSPPRSPQIPALILVLLQPPPPSN